MKRALVAMFAPLFCFGGSAALAQQPAPSPTAAPAGTSARSAIEKQIARAQDLYYGDKASDALSDISELIGRLETEPNVPLKDRVLVQLWLATLSLANNGGLATSAAREAVALDPTGTVDLSVFPPALAELVESVKKTPPPSHMLVINGVPHGATVQLDGHAVVQRGQVTEGRHWLDVDCPGYLHRVVGFDVGATEPVVVDATPIPLVLHPRPTPTPIPRTPLTRRPIFWGIVAAGVLAIAGGAALAQTPSTRTNTEPNPLPTQGTVTWQ